MNVLELINKLKEIPGHLEVFFNDGENGATPMNTIKIEESIIPRGIKYLLLNEADTPPMTELRETDERFNINSPQDEEELPFTNEKKKVKGKKITITKEITTKKKQGVHAKMSEEKTQEIIKLIHEGLKYTNIAKTIGCSISHVSRTAKKQGLRKKKKITTEKEIIIIKQPEPIQVDFTTEKTKGRQAIQKDFNTYNIRCKRCRIGKPKSDYKGTGRICAQCRKRKKKELIK